MGCSSFTKGFRLLRFYCAILFLSNTAIATPNLRYEARDWVNFGSTVELGGLLTEVDYILAAYNEAGEPNIQETSIRLTNGTRYSSCLATGGWGIPLFAVLTKKNERPHITSAATDFDVRKISADTVELTFRVTTITSEGNGSRIPLELNVSPLSCDFSLFANTTNYSAGFTIKDQTGNDRIDTRVTLIAKRLSDINQSDKRYEIIGQPIIDADLIDVEIEDIGSFAPTLLGLDPAIVNFWNFTALEAEQRIENAYNNTRNNVIAQIVGSLTKLAEKGLSINNSANPAKYFFENTFDDYLQGFQTSSADPSAVVEHVSELGAVFTGYPQSPINANPVFGPSIQALSIPAPNSYSPVDPSLLTSEAIEGAPYVNYGDMAQLYTIQLKTFEDLGYFGVNHPHYLRSFQTDAYDYTNMTPTGPQLIQNTTISARMNGLTLLYDPITTSDADGGRLIVIYSVLVDFAGTSAEVTGHYIFPLDEEFYPDRSNQFWGGRLATKFFQAFRIVLSGVDHLVYSSHPALGLQQSQVIADSIVPSFAVPAATSPSMISTETESIAFGSPRDLRAAAEGAGLTVLSDNGNKVNWDRFNEILPQNIRSINVNGQNAPSPRFGRFHDYFLQFESEEPLAGISSRFRAIDQGRGVMTVTVTPANGNKARALIDHELVTAARRTAQEVNIYQKLYLASEEFGSSLANGTLHMLLRGPGEEFVVTSQGYEAFQRNNRFQICGDSLRILENTASSQAQLEAIAFIAGYPTETPLIDGSGATPQILDVVYSAPETPNCGDVTGGGPGTSGSGTRPLSTNIGGTGNHNGGEPQPVRDSSEGSNANVLINP